MAHISGEDQRRYAEAHASAEPVNIFSPGACPHCENADLTRQNSPCLVSVRRGRV